MDYQSLVIGAINLVVVGIIIPLARSVARMRTNELSHLQEALARIEEKLDRHISYHLEKGL